MKCILTIVIENKKLWRQKEQLHLMIYSDIFFPPLISGTFNGYLFRIHINVKYINYHQIKFK